MLSTKRWSAAVALFLCVIGSTAWGQSSIEAREVGVRGGTSSHYDTIELYGRQRADWVEDSLLRGKLPDPVTAHWDLTVGYWDGREENTGFLAVGPVFEIRSAEVWRWSLGVQPTLISNHRDGKRDLGGPFQFTSHLGIAWAPPGALVLGLRVHHTSNARLYDSNPGVDVVSLEAGFTF